ncbi:MAG: hypothetical protein K2G28_02395, partial [Acetatifactor sp.]|nr:hypothetical protein [Acetatifactor sp.]
MNRNTGSSVSCICQARREYASIGLHGAAWQTFGRGMRNFPEYAYASAGLPEAVRGGQIHQGGEGKMKIVVLAGGISAERDVSLSTGGMIY